MMSNGGRLAVSTVPSLKTIQSRMPVITIAPVMEQRGVGTCGLQRARSVRDFRV